MSGSGERWISDSGATENMTPDPTGFERYETAPPGRTVEMGDGTLLPVAGYGDLRLKIEQDDADGGQTRDLVLRRAAHVPGLRHNLLSAAQLSATFEHPMQLWPRAAVFRCPRNGQSVIFRKSARRLFEATARRSAIMDQASAKALVVAKPKFPRFPQRVFNFSGVSPLLPSFPSPPPFLFPPRPRLRTHYRSRPRLLLPAPRTWLPPSVQCAYTEPCERNCLVPVSATSCLQR